MRQLKLKQLNLGKLVGAYYTELTYSLSLVGIGSSLVSLTVLWSVVDLRLYVSWLTYPLFMGIVFFIVLVVLPMFDYFFLYRTRQAFLNRQGYVDNPFKNDLADIKAEIALLRIDIEKNIKTQVQVELRKAQVQVQYKKE